MNLLQSLLQVRHAWPWLRLPEEHVIFCAKWGFCNKEICLSVKEGEDVYGRETSASETTMICMRRAAAWHGEVKGHEAAAFPPCVTSHQGSEDAMGSLLLSTPTGELSVLRGAGCASRMLGEEHSL